MRIRFRKEKKKKTRRVGKLLTGIAVTGLIGYGIKKALEPPGI